MEEKEQGFRFVDGEAQVFEVSIVVRDLDKSLEQFRSLFGMTPYMVRDQKMRDFHLHGTKVDRARIRFACFRAGPIRIELIEAAEGETVFKEFLDKRGIGVQHIGVRVSDLDAELAQLEKRGVRVLQSQDIPQIDFKMAYLDTEDIAGVSFELIQSPGIPAEEEFRQALAAKGMAPRE